MLRFSAGVKQAARLSLLLILCFACRSPEKDRGREPAARVPPVEELDVAARAPQPSGRPRVIWLGLDGLDWEILDRLASEGKMPNWKRLASEGWSARLKSFYPLISPILWTSAATGATPDVHRVLDFQEVDPKTGRKVPISGNSRAVPAVWNLASAAGRKVGVVGWWATHPAEEVNGFFVSDHSSPILFENLPLAGVAFPPTLESGVGQVVARDGRIDEEDLRRFLDPGDQKAGALSRVLAATRVTQRIARDLYDRERPDLLALYFEGTDEVAHLFAPDAPPKLACTSDADFERYGKVVDSYYALIDRLLGQWMRRAKENGATLLVHSDHGFKWGSDRPCGFASGNWATAAFWHRIDGVFAAWGERVSAGRARADASLLDVAPTVLALLSLPADRRMPGRVLSEAFDGIETPKREDLFPKVIVRRVAAQAVASEAASEYAKKLLALGYLSPSETRPLAAPGGDRPGMTEAAWNNLGVYLRDTRKDGKGARAAFDRSLTLRPDYYSALFNVAVLERNEGRDRSAEDWFFRSLAAVVTDPAPAVLGWSHEYQRAGKTAAARSLLERAVRLYPKSEDIARDLALLLFRGHDCPRALSTLGRFESATRDARTLNVLALVQTCLENRPEVVRLLRRSLELKPDQPDVARSLRAAERG
jgi:predicted AlkP superfamily phosphohydrolase/phosphomutase/Flp pilus assembly protein TadD